MTETSKLREALEKCRVRFREYEQGHLSKMKNLDDISAWGTLPKDEIERANGAAYSKAARNREMAELCEAALSLPAETSQQGELPEVPSTIDDAETRAFIAGWNAKLSGEHEFDLALHWWRREQCGLNGVEDLFDPANRVAPPPVANERAWQPIESAPKDGTLVDLWCVQGDDCYRIADVYWQGPKRNKNGWIAPNRDNDGAEGPLYGDEIATHWMPMPTPPGEPAPAVGGERELMRQGILAVSDLLADSAGVYGLHRNGDPAPWEELRTGGRFEEWLLAFDEAEALVRGAHLPADRDGVER